jgi:small-conductance mechanosensitive channel
MTATLTDWWTNITHFLPELVLIAVILVLTRVVSRRTQGLVHRLATNTQAPPEIADLLGRLARIGIVAIGVLLVLDQLNWSGAVLSFIAGLGILGIVIGFALQDIVKQFAAGVLLLMLRPFRIGDDVKIGEFEGRVTQVQLRATVLKTRNGDEVLIPNADVYTTAITNTSRYDLRQHTVTLNISQELDLEQACAAMLQAVGDTPGVSANPPPQVVAIGLHEETVKLEARFWIDERVSNEDTVRSSVITAIRRAIAQLDGDREKGRQGEGETE